MVLKYGHFILGGKNLGTNGEKYNFIMAFKKFSGLALKYKNIRVKSVQNTRVLKEKEYRISSNRRRPRL